MNADATASPPPPSSTTLLDALRGRDYAAAEHLLAHVPLDPAQLNTMAEGLMRRRRWGEAAWLFSRVAGHDTATEMKRCLSGNLAALQTHRPGVYAQLVALPSTASFGIAPSASGLPTILARRADGSAVNLSSGPDPLTSAHRIREQLRQATRKGEAVALCGFGDGYVLQRLAQTPPELFMDMEQAVFLLEPEPQVVLHGLMIHDLAQPDGPIVAERFRWFVGSDWSNSFDAAIERQPTIGIPTVMIQQGLDASAVQVHVQSQIAALGRRDLAAAAAVDTYYATVTPATLAEVMAPNPPRPPRVMLITTRFSTVLQYSTRDTADAFRQLGWEALVLIEPAPSHRMYHHTFRTALAEFKPDLIFQIDHLRHEHPGLFPPNLPFVCWGQDHLPNLITTDAGRRVGPMDFVMTDNTVAYAEVYEYPRRQLIPTTKLTATAEAAPTLPARATEAEDVVFVSNASGRPVQLLNEVAAGWDGSSTALDVLQEAAREVSGRYAAGGTISTYGEVRSILGRTMAGRGIALSPEEMLHVSKWLTHPFNDALYRQQALRWAISAAKRLGLSVGLYGNGWDAHPEFAQYARGPVAYGDALSSLTRSATVNLQIVPYLCLHQRLLDGLGAGGFFLVRHNPNDFLPQALLNFVTRHAPGVRTADEARAAIDSARIAEFEALLEAAAVGTTSSEGEDVVTLVTDWVDAGLLVPGGEVLPRVAEVSFDSERRVTELLARFAGEPGLRGEIAAEQRRAVVGRLTYTAGMKRAVRTIAARLRDTADQASTGVRQCA